MHMTSKYTLITYNGKPARQYPDGSIRDTNGRFMAQHPAGDEITRENAREYQQLGVEAKRRTLRQAANDAVERGDISLGYGQHAYIAEIGQAMQRKATNIDDPKAVDAARFLLQETGVSEKQGAATADNSDASAILAGLGAEMVRHIMRRARND